MSKFLARLLAFLETALTALGNADPILLAQAEIKLSYRPLV